MSPLEIAAGALPPAIGLILIGAGAAKLADLAGFAVTLAGLGIPRRWATAAARSLALAEAGIGALGFAGVARTAVATATFALTLGFLAVTAAAARWRPQVRCRCFGALADSRFGKASLARGLALAAASGLALTQTGTAHYPLWATALLLAFAALFALCCAAAAKAVDLVHAGGAR